MPATTRPRDHASQSVTDVCTKCAGTEPRTTRRAACDRLSTLAGVPPGYLSEHPVCLGRVRVRETRAPPRLPRARDPESPRNEDHIEKLWSDAPLSGRPGWSRVVAR